MKVGLEPTYASVFFSMINYFILVSEVGFEHNEAGMTHVCSKV